VGGKGVFVKELEEALADGRADLAVHSAKDVPFALPDGFRLCAYLPRADPRDALIAPKARTFAQLPKGARVGTSSLRRAVQLLFARPDLVMVPVRGNVRTRLEKATGPLDGSAGTGERLDAVVLALAGLARLGLDGHVTEALSIDLSLPAGGQAAMAIEVLAGSRGDEACAPLSDLPCAQAVRAERAVLARLQGGCTIPVAAHALHEGNVLWLRALLGGPEGAGVRLVHAEARGPAGEPEALGTRVAELLLERGGGPLLEAARTQALGLLSPKRS
jgi:hydroxymethylbilane synthase